MNRTFPDLRENFEVKECNLIHQKTSEKVCDRILRQVLSLIGSKFGSEVLSGRDTGICSVDCRDM